MKKLLLIGAGIFFTLQASAQKIEFGVTAGYLNIGAASSATSSTYGNEEESSDASGFYAGILADIAISEAFYVQPGVTYGYADESNILSIPLLAKYYVLDSGFNLVAGPQATVILDDLPGTVNSVGYDFSFGGGYDFNEDFFVQARYSLELTNRFDDSVGGLRQDVDFKYRVNTLFVGLGYKF